MDISVRHLNNRMALQVPAELPLGLVFVVGRARNLAMPETDAEDRSDYVHFELSDGDHRLRCTLPRSVVQETLLQEGDRVRVSGQLAFDSRAVRYLLFARDLEVLAGRSAVTSVGNLLPDAKQQAQETDIVPADLPSWVRQLAPPEVQLELGLLDEIPEPEEAQLSYGPAYLKEPASGGREEMPEEMLAFLSSVIDSDEETELTPEMIAEYLPQETPPLSSSAGRGLEKAAYPAEESARLPAERTGPFHAGTPQSGTAVETEADPATSMRATLLQLFVELRAAMAWLWRFRLHIALAFLILSLTVATVIFVLLLRHWSFF